MEAGATDNRFKKDSGFGKGGIKDEGSRSLYGKLPNWMWRVFWGAAELLRYLAFSIKSPQ